MKAARAVITAAIVGVLTGCSASAPVTPNCPRPLSHWHHAGTGRFSLGMPGGIDITLGHGRLLFGGKPENEASMMSLLREASDMVHPRWPLTYDPSGATSCAEATRIRDRIDASFACKENRCWQGSHAALDAAPLADGEVDAPW